MLDILLIHVPMVTAKKSHDTLFPFSKSINYGLLSLGSYLEQKGHSVKILDNREAPIQQNIDQIIATTHTLRPRIVGLSCISGFSYPNLLIISRAIKKACSNIPIIAGGKDNIGLFAHELINECKDIDIVATGEGEEATNLVLKHLKLGESYHNIPNIYFRNNNFNAPQKTNSTSATLDLLPFNCNLYPGIQSFPPVVEISRGCPFNCNFCVSSRSKVRKKPIKSIINEIAELCKIYNNDQIKLYFESPNMLFTNKEIDQLIALKKSTNLNFTYRAETRVEYLATHSMERLAETGLRVIDLGLESGSKEILQRMGKTNNPNRYLSSTKKILKRAHELGIIIKLNILFYVGETRKTIKETVSFLDKSEPYIRSLSAYPLIGFHYYKFTERIYKDLALYGGSTVNDEHWAKMKLTPINPSSEYSYGDLTNISSLIIKSYQSEFDFFQQKQYGYFSPKVTLLDFSNSIQLHSQDELPFYRTKKEKLAAKKALINLIY